MFFLLISRMNIYIFLLFSMTVTYYIFCVSKQASLVESFAIWTGYSLSLITYQLFQIWPSSYSALFIFRTILGHSAHVSIFTIWQTSSYTAVSTFLVIEATYYSSWDFVLFWTRLPFVAMDMIHWLCCVIQNDMLNVYHSPAYLFLFTFPFQHGISFGDCLSCSIVQCYGNIFFLIWLSLHMLH